MTPKRWFRLIIFSISVLHLPAAIANDKPDLMLAETYQQGINVSQYWISEKLDGVRARWDGSQLVSRGGKVFAAPAWFTKGFPAVPLDGELWIGRGQYEKCLPWSEENSPMTAGGIFA